MLKTSGIDTNVFTGHSTRHASTSKAFAKGVDMVTIKKAAGWSEDSKMFAKVYNQPIVEENCEFARAVLSTS